MGSGSGRWGTDVPGTHWREGDAGHHVCLEGPMGDTPGSPTVSMKLQNIAEQAQREAPGKFEAERFTATAQN
jgi:hypothetical protein